MYEIDTGGSDRDWKIYQSIQQIETDIKLSYNTCPIFLSHVNDIILGYKKPLIQLDNKKFLFRTEIDYKLGNNVCPHQGSLIIDEPSKELSCRYHGWKWNDLGEPQESKTTTCKNTSRIILQDTFLSNSLIFSSDIDISGIGVDFYNMELVEQRIDVVRSNFKNIVDVFLDADHIPVVHKDVYGQIGISDDVNISWEFFDWGSIQKVFRTKKNSMNFTKTLLNIDEERLSAIWITVYPYTMIEWQPGALFVTVCSPKDKETDVLVLKYKDSRYNNDNWNINSCIWEKAWFQDKHQSELIVRTLGYHPNLEKSKLKFREFLDRS